jgi:hypothetical protein
MNPSNWLQANLTQVVIALAQSGAILQAQTATQPEIASNEQVAQ